MTAFDITILTEKRYYQPKNITPYIANVLLEDELLEKAIASAGLRVTRKSWDDPDFDWSSTRFALFRTTWDYFHRFAEFEQWLKKAGQVTRFINEIDLIYWNVDKHYLGDLAKKGINIAPTHYFEKGKNLSLVACLSDLTYDEYILKPAIAGTARHTYRFKKDEAAKHEAVFRELIQHESLLIQEYQKQITTKGEISIVLFGGIYSHAVRKTAKPGDFRVQDDFGGTVHQHEARPEEIEFAQKALLACKPFEPIYARVDIFWDNQDNLCLAELEMIEPELWFRKDEHAAGLFASVLAEYMREK